MFYSKSKEGFYDSEIHLEMPKDAIEISQEVYQALFAAQANGQEIVSDKGGNPLAVDRTPLSKEEQIKFYEFYAQTKLDDIAKSWGYDSLISAVSYTNSKNLQFKAEANALIDWRDAYWAEAYTIEMGPLPATAEAFFAMLPEAPTKPII
jgi:hypothetical protein